MNTTTFFALKVLFTLTLLALLSACSTAVTHPIAFKKSPWINDQQRLLSLLNRPLPQDKVMMMKFAQQNNYNNAEFPYVNYIAIRGDKSTDNDLMPSAIYGQLIYNDPNAIMVGAPQ